MEDRQRFSGVLMLAVALVAGCGQSVSPPNPVSAAATGGGTPDRPVTAPSATAPSSAPPPGSGSAPATAPAPPSSAPTQAPTEADAAGAEFSSGVRALTQAEQTAMTGVTWREGCPVGLDELRHVSLAYWDFDGRTRQGALVVHADVADRTVDVFQTLYDQKFPIRRMEPIEAYGGDDFASIEADNTSAFNCRQATGSQRWSNHAYGRAIDLNPLENPYVFDGGRTSHPRSEPYLDRALVRPGMVVEGSPAVAAFDAAGFAWGGRWESPVDTQHFEIESR